MGRGRGRNEGRGKGVKGGRRVLCGEGKGRVYVERREGEGVERREERSETKGRVICGELEWERRREPCVGK